MLSGNFDRGRVLGQERDLELRVRDRRRRRRRRCQRRPLKFFKIMFIEFF